MVRSMIEELYEALRADVELGEVCLNTYIRPETLRDNESSVVILPVGPPMQAVPGSNRMLAKTFLFQVNVESIDPKECKILQRQVEKVLEKKRFYQIEGGLDTYLDDIRRYVDARTYRGLSRLYEEY